MAPLLAEVLEKIRGVFVGEVMVVKDVAVADDCEVVVVPETACTCGEDANPMPMLPHKTWCPKHGE